MKKYVEFEKQTINQYKRGLISFDTCAGTLRGYLECMVDMGVLDSDRLKEEYTISMSKVLTLSVKING